MDLWPFRVLAGAAYASGCRDGATAVVLAELAMAAVALILASVWRPDMRRQYLTGGLTLLAAILLWYSGATHGGDVVAPPPVIQPPAPAAPAKPTDKDKPDRPLRKLLVGDPSIAPGAPVNGGKTSPDGSVEIACDLPEQYRLRNTGGMGPRGPGTGAGLCVWTSITRSAWLQYVTILEGLQKWMTSQPGGGYPSKVDDFLAKYCKEKGVPVPRYINHTAGDMAFLRAAIKTGRMPAITYCGEDPHYRGQRVSHMVNLVYLGEKWACIADNNFPGGDDFVWMSVSEFEKRWKGFGMGWAVVLLDPPPPPVPHN